MENNRTNQIKEDQVIVGWGDANEVASSIWSSIHSSLLSGKLVFAYKPYKESELTQLVVVRNLKNDTYGRVMDKDYAVGMMTSGFSMLLPHVPLEYLENDLVNDMNKYKVDKETIETFKKFIKFFEEKYGSK
jgi:hypothetical protein